MDTSTSLPESLVTSLSPPRPRVGRERFLAAAAIWIAAIVSVGPIARWVTVQLLRLDPDGHLGSAVVFFLEDAPRVLLLLVGVVFVMNVVNSYFTVERAHALLAGRRRYGGNVFAALLGVVTPFCSCSAVPLFIGFVEAGIPVGITFSFLVSAPMVNEVALVLLLGMFGWRVALLYLASGVTIAIVSGVILGWLGADDHVEDWVRARLKFSLPPQQRPLTLAERGGAAFEAVRRITAKVWPYILGGIAVGAFIHGYVPEGVLVQFVGRSAWWAVPVAVAAGVPLYSSAAALVPMIQPLLAKGAALGTVLAFMMAVVGLSLPEMIMLRRVLKPRLIAALVGVVATGILLTGWLFNAIL
ncbi:permease [Anaeromyxobacter oryzisoli]|uniref:permease n=1 Tax=Anaeromyxobacter oryzisoli TaxID=2925408 RepID=UPI001F597B16|nr:permease [Anaeromyxobacter sp. SG63]